MRDCTALAWPLSRLGEAIEALGRLGRLGVKAVEVEAPPPGVGVAPEEVGPWIEAAAEWLGLEAEPVEASYGEVEQLVGRAGPALFLLRGAAEPTFLALLGGKGRRVDLLTPERGVVQVRQENVCQELCRAVEAPVADQVEGCLTQAGLRGRRRPRARAALLRQLLAPARVEGCWLLRPAGTAVLASLAREARVPRLLGTLLAAHALDYGLWILSWGLLGWMSLTGRFETGWLLAWLLLLLASLPLRLLGTAAGGRLAIRAGAVLKTRLLVGALRLGPDEVRHLGAGQLLGRVIESEVVETMAIAGGFLGVTAAIDLLLAGWVLGAGAGSWVHIVLLAVTALGALVLARGYYCRRRQWTEERLTLTNHLVEQMLGHRTRLAQEARPYWNEGEDQLLERYLGVTRDLDRATAVLQVLVPRGWLVVALLGLCPVFLAGRPSAGALAVSLGGVLLATRALRQLAEGLERLMAAGLAWERLKPYWQAAALAEVFGPPRLSLAGTDSTCPDRDGPLLDVRDLTFRHKDRSSPVLQGVVLQVLAGERLLLEGPSGGGKSTLAALVAGARTPAAGLRLLNGLDLETLGAGRWRRRVVLVPQFHDNHVLMGTLAFNLLLGRGWPPRAADLEEAERVCRELDLGPLLDRMPAGLQQLIGETGWQLSHGEKSRVYVARALLQKADLIILDESFAALDPQTLRQALTVVLARAPTVLVIAHP
jgi:ATP-binding cassette subfamily B protein